MPVTQLAVFLENKTGRLAEVTRALGDAGVNIRGFSVADTSEYGILRVIVDDPDRAYEALKRKSFTVHRSDVLCVRVPDKPGGLARVLEALGERGINVEYIYPTALADIVFGVERLQEASECLKAAGTPVVEGSELRGG